MSVSNPIVSRFIHCALPLVLAVGACDDDSSAGDEAPLDPEVVTTERGRRICEIFELIIIDEHVGVDVWNNGNFHDCPDDYLAAIDRGRFSIGGPRWRSVDELEAVDMDGSPVEFEPLAAEVPEGLGYEMFRAAQVALVPLAELEQMLGITIESLDDLPPQLRDAILSSAVAGRSYEVVEVLRTTTTRMVHHAGSEVFVLDDGQCRYAMKYYTSVVDPTLTNEGAIAQLGDRLESLPEGWSFQVMTFDEDLVVAETEGIAYVVNDEFGNSYDRYACD